jgi:hypothetical protein
MKKTERKKLTLSRETIKELRNGLGAAAGGRSDPGHSPCGCATDSDQSACCGVMMQ